MGVYVPKRHYKFNLKLIKYNIFEKIFNKTINSYLNEMKNTSTTYFTDTTFIWNSSELRSFAFQADNSAKAPLSACNLIILLIIYKNITYNIPT